MCGLTKNRCQKLGDLIVQHTIHMTLHWAEKVVIEALHFNLLVDQEYDNTTCLRFCISQISKKYASMLWSCSGIVSKDIHWSVEIMYY